MNVHFTNPAPALMVPALMVAAAAAAAAGAGAGQELVGLGYSHMSF